MTTVLHRAATAALTDAREMWHGLRADVPLPLVVAVVVFALVVVPGVVVTRIVWQVRGALGRPSPHDTRYWPVKLATHDQVAAGTVVAWAYRTDEHGRPWTLVTVTGDIAHTQYTSDGLKVLARDEMTVIVPGDADANGDILTHLRDTGVPVEASQRCTWPTPTTRRPGPFRIASLLGDAAIHSPGQA